MMMFLTGTDIEAIRKHMGMTQQAFADFLGVTDAAVCLWEGNQRRPRYPMMERLNKLAEEKRVRLPGQRRREAQPA